MSSGKKDSSLFRKTKKCLAERKSMLYLEDICIPLEIIEKICGFPFLFFFSFLNPSVHLQSQKAKPFLPTFPCLYRCESLGLPRNISGIGFKNTEEISTKTTSLLMIKFCLCLLQSEESTLIIDFLPAFFSFTITK